MVTFLEERLVQMPLGDAVLAILRQLGKPSPCKIKICHSLFMSTARETIRQWLQHRPQVSFDDPYGLDGNAEQDLIDPNLQRIFDLFDHPDLRNVCKLEMALWRLAELYDPSEIRMIAGDRMAEELGRTRQ